MAQLAFTLARPDLKWFSYVQDFDLPFAEEWIKRLAQPGLPVLDPFAGTGTTLLAARSLGHPSVGLELSPLMAQMARARLDWNIDASLVRSKAQEIAAALVEAPTHPSAHEFFAGDPLMLRWISERAVSDVLTAVDQAAMVRRVRERRFLFAAIASVLSRISNMEYRPNISYKKRPAGEALASVLPAQIEFMLQDIAAARRLVPSEAAWRVLEGDARAVYRRANRYGPYGLLFSSPPYPNDMEYVHQTRMELQLFGYARARAGLRNLKQKMITSSVKLVYSANFWQYDEGLKVDGVREVVAQLDETLKDKNWGWDAAQMVAEYFGGMRTVLSGAYRVLSPGAAAAWVVGDSAFNGVFVPTNQLFANAAESVGFHVEAIEVFRPRWNTKHSTTLSEAVIVTRR